MYLKYLERGWASRHLWSGVSNLCRLTYIFISVVLIAGCRGDRYGFDAGERFQDRDGHVEHAHEIDPTPDNFPPIFISDDNPLTREKIELGRHLFYDKRLSADESMSCGSCHIQDKAFTDGLPTSPALHEGEFTRRNAMSLVNIAYAPSLTWVNPTLVRLSDQAGAVFFGEEPAELGGTGNEALILNRLKSVPEYVEWMSSAFPDEEEPFHFGNVFRAIEAFEKTLISNDSPYDRYIAGDLEALSDSAERGLQLFNSERLDCTHCHNGFNFAGPVLSANTVNLEMEFFNTGLYNIDGMGGVPSIDRGLMEHTSRPEDEGKFRAPTLRNIEMTAPYMHDGTIETLEDVIKHYARGGRLIPEGPYAGDGKDSPLKSRLINGFEITDSEIEDVVSFLKSLTDETFLTNPDYRDPFGEI